MFDPQLGPQGPEERPPTAGERRFIFWFMAIFGLLLLAEIAKDFSPIKLAILFFLLAYPVLTVIHEGGHALMARWVGWRVERVVIGVGPVWRATEIGGVPVELRRVPLGGFVVPVPERLDRPRLSNALIFFAGPGAELLVIGLIALILGGDLLQPSDRLPVIFAQSVAAAAAVGAAHNLIPFRTAEGQMSDGLGVLSSLSLTREDLELRQVMPDLLEAEARLEAGDLKGGQVALEAIRAAHPDHLLVELMISEMEARLGGRRGEMLMHVAQLGRRADLSERDKALVEATLARIRGLS